MKPELFRLTACPDCQGYGTLRQKEGSLTCHRCNGIGSWLVDEGGRQLYFPFPQAGATAWRPSSHQIHVLAVVGSVAFFLLFLFLAFKIFIANGNDPLAIVWRRGIGQAGTGLSGLAAAWLLSIAERRQTSHYSLHDLEAWLTNPQQQVDGNLLLYSNARIEEVLRQCGALAAEHRSNQIDEAILLIAVLNHPRILNLLSRLEISPYDIVSQAVALISTPQADTLQTAGFLPEARLRMYSAFEEAVANRFPYIDLEDILLSYLKQPGRFAPLFQAFKVTYKQAYAVSHWFAEDQERARQWAFWLEKGRHRSNGYMNRAWTALPTPFIDRYSTDLTRLAARGAVPTVTVRDREIEQLLEILGRTEKNSAILVGEPGVGKETLLTAIALRMIEERVPATLQDRRLISMDLGALLSGGDSAEQNIEKVLEEVAQAGNVILAIPDVHVLVGSSGTALDAASLLSNAIGKGYLQVITIATYADYHRYVESNPTLSSLLERIEIKEVSAEQAIEILEEEAPRIEAAQGCTLTYPAIRAAVELAKRYLPEKALPSSAMDLIDQAASGARQAKNRWVTKQDIEKTVEKMTEIPVQNAQAEEASTLLHLEDELHKRVIGQEEAIKAVSGSLRRARAGLHDGKRPISSFLFVGPTGVGKTETAKAVCEVFFGAKAPMIRLDMSEYQDPRSVYRLIGAPPADSDSFSEGGSLTQPVREHPFSLILLDELEKAHPDVLNLFLQLLDDGRLTENSGRTVHYNNTIVVATSNAGSSELVQLLGNKASADEVTSRVMEILQKQFRPEFLNRFDAIIPFHPLTPAEIGQVAQLMLSQVIATAKAQGYTVSFTPDLIETVVREGYDPLYGARPLRRYIQDKVEGALANKILEGALASGGSLQMDAEMIQ